MPVSDYPPANAEQQMRSQKDDNRTSNVGVQAPPAFSPSKTAKQSAEPPVILSPPSKLTVQPEVSNKTSFPDNLNTLNVNERTPNATVQAPGVKESSTAKQYTKPSAMSVTKKANRPPKPAVQPVISKKASPAAVPSGAKKQSPEPPVLPKTEKPGQPSNQIVQPAVSEETFFWKALIVCSLSMPGTAGLLEVTARSLRRGTAATAGRRKAAAPGRAFSA